MNQIRSNSRCNFCLARTEQATAEWMPNLPSGIKEILANFFWFIKFKRTKVVFHYQIDLGKSGSQSSSWLAGCYMAFLSLACCGSLAICADTNAVSSWIFPCLADLNFMLSIFFSSAFFFWTSLLPDKWSPALQIRTVLLSIQALLSAPNPDDPLANDVAEQWKKNESNAIETGED